MGHDDETGAEFAIEFQHQFEHLCRVPAVEVAGRFVGQHQSRLSYEGASHRGALPFAAGELGGAMREAFCQSNSRQQSARTFPGGARLHSPHQQRHGDIFERGEFRQQVMELIDESNGAIAQMSALGIVQSIHCGSGDLHRTAGRQIESSQQLQKRRLPGSRGTDDGNALAGTDADGRCSKHLDFHIALDELLGKILAQEHHLS